MSGGAGRVVADGDETGLARMCAGYAQLVLEAEAGLRPRAQVERVMDPRLVAQLDRHLVRPGPRRRVLGLRGGLVAPGVYEAAVAVGGTGRAGAIFIRVERQGRGWSVTALGRPEDGELPEPLVQPPAPARCAFELVLGSAAAGPERPELAAVVGL